ncbi:MAG: peptidase S9B, partial [Linnemannia elongata]
RADPKLGGSELDLVAFTRDQDIWVMTLGGVETQLTFCSRNKKKSDISCGIAEFVMQEEFHRFSNYCWAPSTPLRPTERILYLQVSEAMVDLVVIPRHGMHPEFEEYRYPHAGTPNAVSDIQIVEFDVVPEPLHKRLWGRVSLYKMFPWIEYIVRFGWLPGGER